MADIFAATLVSADEDQNTVTNQMFIQLTDGTNGVANTGTSLNVAVTEITPGVGATDLGKAVDSVAGATDTGVAALAVRDDVLTTLTPVDGDYTNLRVDSTGALWITGNITASPESVFIDDSAFTVGTSEVTAIGGIATGDSVDAGDVGALRMLLNRALVVTLEDASGNPNAAAFPAYVSVAGSAVADRLLDYDTATVAGSGTSNHDYTVTGTAATLKQVILSASGGAKAEIQAGPIAGLVSQAVIFVPKHGGTEQVEFAEGINVPVTGTGTIRVIRTNREGASQDVYTTIIGTDI